jgi:hypothetical protein
MLITLEQVGVLLLFCAIGYVLAKKRILKSEKSDLISDSTKHASGNIRSRFRGTTPFFPA